MTNCSCGFSPGHRALQIFSTLTGILQIKVSESESSWANALVCHRNCDQHLQTASPLRGEHSWDWPILPFCGNLVSVALSEEFLAHTGLMSEPPCTNNMEGTRSSTDQGLTWQYGSSGPASAFQWKVQFRSTPWIPTQQSTELMLQFLCLCPSDLSRIWVLISGFAELGFIYHLIECGIRNTVCLAPPKFGKYTGLCYFKSSNFFLKIRGYSKTQEGK